MSEYEDLEGRIHWFVWIQVAMHVWKYYRIPIFGTITNISALKVPEISWKSFFFPRYFKAWSPRFFLDLQAANFKSHFSIVFVICRILKRNISHSPKKCSWWTFFFSFDDSVTAGHVQWWCMSPSSSAFILLSTANRKWRWVSFPLISWNDIIYEFWWQSTTLNKT